MPIHEMYQTLKGWLVAWTQPVKNIFEEMNRYMVSKGCSQNDKQQYYYEFSFIPESKVNKYCQVKRYPYGNTAYHMHNLVPERGIT
jgi:hypothetical protein